MKYKNLPPYGRIIYITVVIYAITQLWKLLGVLLCWSSYDLTTQWLALPSNLNELALRPWSLLTYMFSHADLSQNPLHIVFNMLWLWWFGQFFVRRHTSLQFVSFYLTSGIVAGLFFVVCYNLFPYFALDRFRSYVIGASGAIFALIAAVAIQQPDERIGLNLFVKVAWVKMKWLCVAVLVINLMSVEPGTNDGGLVCHLGGLLFGILYGWMERRGKDITAWPLRLISGISKQMEQLRKPRMSAARGGRREPIGADKKRDMDYNTERRKREEEIDQILEKISKNGYDGLTAEEKQALFDASKRKR